MNKKKSFIKQIQKWGVVLLSSFGIVLIGVNVVFNYNDFLNKSSEMRSAYLNQQKDVIRNQVNLVVNRIDNGVLKNEFQAQKQTSDRVNEAYSILQNLYDQYKSTKNIVEIKKLAINVLRPIRFDNERGYYFINDLSNNVILYPTIPSYEGQNIRELQDITGKYVSKEQTRIAKDIGEGYTIGYWPKPNSADPDKGYKKMTYVKLFKPFSWTIGTGIYVDSIHDDMQDVINNNLKRYRFGKYKRGYIFILELLDINGGEKFAKMFVNANRPDIIGNYISDEYKDAKGKQFRKEFLKGLREDGECFVKYWYKKIDTDEVGPKVSFFKLTKNKEYIVASGIYFDDLEIEILKLQSDLKKKITNEILYIFLIGAFTVLLLLFLLNFLTKKMKKDYTLFISFFQKAAFSDEIIDRNEIEFYELDKIAESSNKMLEDKVKLQEDIVANEKNYRMITESTSDLIGKIDLTGKYIYVSPSHSIFGYKKEDLLGKIGMDFIHPDDSKDLPKLLQDSIENPRNEIEMLEYRFKDKYNNWHDLHCKFNFILNNEGIPESLMVISRDITEMKKAEGELQKMQKLQSVGTLAGGIAHDFNNILTGVFGNISLAKLNTSKDHKNYRYLSQAEKSMYRATQLTKQLLTFAKGGSLIKENVKISELINEVVKFDLSGSNVKPIFKEADDLWNSEIDKGQISQVFSNLTINANQATPNGGYLYITMGNIRFLRDNEILGLEKGPYIKIIFQDEGIGIDEKYCKSIFDPYFTTKQAGHGLGLATSYSIIKKHKGDINVESELGTGTKFIVYLPAIELNYSKEINNPSVNTDIGKVAKASVLIMDDEEMICKLATEMIQELGHSVKSTMDGEETISVYKESIKKNEPFDIVIMDLTIPGGMGGKETIAHILKINPNAKVIVSSGYSSGAEIANYLKYGFKEILEKPYTMENLKATLDSVLKSEE